MPFPLCALELREGSDSFQSHVTESASLNSTNQPARNVNSGVVCLIIIGTEERAYRNPSRDRYQQDCTLTYCSGYLTAGGHPRAPKRRNANHVTKGGNR